MECVLYSQEQNLSNERKTGMVIAITLFMMIAEIVGGMMFGSMSLLADGIHMGTHAAALGITVIAYRFARVHQRNQNFSFGTGKIGVLAGYTSALILLAAAFGMVWESGERLLSPVPIRFGEALVVAVIGLVVNLISAVLLGHDHDHDHDHDHHEHGHDHHDHHHHHEDHNIRAAYLHVIADAVTSVAAIVALVAGRYFNIVWLDPVVAVLGAIMIIRWAVALLRDSGTILLDYFPSDAIRTQTESIVRSYDRELKDFHCWKIDASGLGIIMTVTGDRGSDDLLRTEVMSSLPVIHCTVECV